MFRISRFQELMKGLPRGEFDRLVERRSANKHSKGFGCWDQLVAMVYAQFSAVSSLRELEAGFNAQSNHHYHMGTGPIRRSTLADANARRNVELFADVVRSLMGRLHGRLRRECKELLYLLDSTSITLKGRGFDDWTFESRTRRTQGIKLHVLYAQSAAVAVRHSITSPNVNDIEEAVKLPIENGATYVFDKGYCDYNWWWSLHSQGALFVTRFKKNASLKIQSHRAIAPQDAAEVLDDSIVRFANPHPRAGRRNRYSAPLRRVVIARPDKPTPLILATNDLNSPAAVIGERYKQRWQIELFFKWIKQHLKIKRFLGHSENAVRTQLLCALIAHLLLALYKHATAASKSMWELLCELRATLFQRPGVEIHAYRRRRQRADEFARLQSPLFA